MLKKYPFYIRATVILLGLILFSYALFNLRGILIPLSFAAFLAVLLNPLVNLFQRWKFPRLAAIILSLVIAIVVISAIAYFLSMQIASFTDQIPVFQKKSLELISRLQHEINHRFGITMTKQNQWINETGAGMKPLIGQTLGTVMGTLALVFLLPVYTFLFLFYKTLILDFLYEIFAEENAKEVSTVLSQVKLAIQSYMFGLLLEALIVATLNASALMLLGVQYAILLGILGAILNMLPFIGGILAVILPILIATVTKDGFHTQLLVIIAYIVIQFTDNHFLVPYIVSSKVKINALISIIVVLLGGAVWGVSGMFLSIPFIGVLKIIFDRIPELKPWGKLLGDDIPIFHKGQLRLKIRGPRMRAKVKT
ncbi:MAG TPA: AI-2E family transporter [Puia sp.]|nr:AI-2E family transporter [Puia sp.]